MGIGIFLLRKHRLICKLKYPSTVFSCRVYHREAYFLVLVCLVYQRICRPVLSREAQCILLGGNTERGKRELAHRRFITLYRLLRSTPDREAPVLRALTRTV